MDDARYGLHGLRIRPAGGPPELRLPLFAAWDARHYAEPVVVDVVRGLRDYVREHYAVVATG